MNSRLVFLAIACLAIGLTACNRFYTNPDFERKARQHKTIAVLPYEIQITGRLPKELTDTLRRQLEEAESIAFQRNFYDKIHIVGGRGQRELTVRVQPVDRTNELLKQNGIGIRESWQRDPQKLAQLLGVDAVVRARATKQRFLSDLESIGVQVGTTILGAIFGFPGVGWAARTNEVEVSANIIDGTSGELLFAGRDEVAVDWSRPANEAIEQINRRICRRFPYTD